VSQTTNQLPSAAPDAGTIVPTDWPRRDIDRRVGQRVRGFQVVIRQSVLNEIHAHGKTTTRVEVGGVLVGDVYHDDDGPYLLIHAAVPADCTRSDAAHVTFTGETWAHIHRQMDEKFPDARIVGWYHTHPDFGIFLSEMDLFIQRNFFDLPWQVAFVYDPVRGDEGMFVWCAGEPTRQAVLVENDTDQPAAKDGNPRLSDGPPGELSPAENLATPVDEIATAASFWSILLVFVTLLAAAVAVVEWFDRHGQTGSK